MTNSRVKDYYDLYAFIQREKINSKTLALAITATFDRRTMRIPKELPIGLTVEYAGDATRQKLWQTFLNKNSLTDISLHVVIDKIVEQFLPAWKHAIKLSKLMQERFRLIASLPGLLVSVCAVFLEMNFINAKMSAFRKTRNNSCGLNG